MSKLSKNSKRILGVAAACLMLVGWSGSSQAQTCTVANWDAATNLVDGADNATGDVGTPPEFIRYAGPCALKVQFGGDPNWVENTTDMSDNPFNEGSYIARFYVYLPAGTGTAVPIFQANDGLVPLFEVIVDFGSGLFAIDANGDGTADSGTPASSAPALLNAWNSVELDYDGTAGTLDVYINDDDSVLSFISVAGSVSRVRLGDIDGGVGSGIAYFDDFDSRRSSRPRRLLAGDADGNQTVDVDDAIAAIDEFMGRGVAPAQPDCNEDGKVDVDDFVCAIDVFMGRR